MTSQAVGYKIPYENYHFLSVVVHGFEMHLCLNYEERMETQINFMMLKLSEILNFFHNEVVNLIHINKKINNV